MLTRSVKMQIAEFPSFTDTRENRYIGGVEKREGWAKTNENWG